MSNAEFAGISRFHRVTILAGIVFCAMMATRFILFYSRTGASHYLAYTGIAVVAGIGMTIYLVNFWKNGLR